MRQVGIALFTVLLLSTTLPLRASAQSLSRIIQDSRSDIEVRNGHLVGPGEVEIREAVSHACYIFLGEDHGIAEVPEFAEGITNISMGDGIRTLGRHGSRGGVGDERRRGARRDERRARRVAIPRPGIE